MEILAEHSTSAGATEARRAREWLQEVLSNYEIEEGNAFLLACAEILVNLSRYPDPRPQNCFIRFGRDAQRWVLEILDDGGSFNDFHHHLSDSGSLDAAEHGMGIRLLAQMFPEVHYVPACYRADSLNLLHFALPQAEEQARQPLVMLIDDDRSILLLLKAYLTDQYRVITATSVAEALDKVMRFRPDILVSDIRMPESEGFQLFDQLNRMPDTSTLPFIFLSGCDDPDTLMRSSERPIDDFLNKPVSKQQLQSSIARALKRRSHLTAQLNQALQQRITLGLQPALPERVGPCQASLRTRAAEPGGGDLVLLRQVEGESPSVILIFADLMGHGAEAKGFAYALAGYLRGLCAAMCDQLSPAQLLAAVSREFADDSVLSKTLATILVVQLFEDGTLCLANAGHPLPLIQRGGELIRLQVSGGLPGLMTGEIYQEERFQLKKGERLILWSDGICDAAEALAEPLTQILQRYATEPLERCADQMMQWYDQQRDHDDDATLILLQRE